jgi:hypothetical protein
MEKRSGERFNVGNGFYARVNREEELAVKDISVCGMCIERPLCLIPNNVYHFELPFPVMGTLTTKGVVVRSYLKSMQGDKTINSTLYHAGIKFIELTHHEIKLLESLIGHVIP